MHWNKSALLKRNKSAFRLGVCVSRLWVVAFLRRDSIVEIIGVDEI